MLFSVIASLLLATGAQPADQADPAAEPAAEAAEEPAEAPEAVKGEEDAPDARKVCRRRTVQDAFGKMKSVKSCRVKIDD